jgi:hypothetical protein
MPIRGPGFSTSISALLVIGAWCAASSPTAADEAFETAEPSWRLVESDCGARLTLQQRVFDQSHSGRGCEMLRLFAGRGSYAYLAHDVDRVRVIAEFTPSLWIKSDLPGLQLLARVVLPRTPDARGGAMTTLLAGTSYQNVGEWQRLSIDNVPLALQRQERVLRAQHGPLVDAREAYVDLLLVNVFGGPGVTTVWTDDLELGASIETASSTGGVSALPTAPAGGASGATGDRRTNWAAPKLHGSVLEADGRPLLVRALEHNGEPLEWVQSLGFNAVWLNRPAGEELLSEAARTGVWLIAPPPQAFGGRINALHSRVLAWNLGPQLDIADSERVRQLAADVRRDDPAAGRPLVGGARSGIWQLSRSLDVLLVRRDPLGGSFELSVYRDWLVERTRLARPGNPIWAAVQTEHAPELIAQWAALGHPAPASVPVDPQQVRHLACAAIAAGARGIVYSSNTRLDATDDATQLRAANLRLVNAQLAMLEPWAAGGDVIGDAETSLATVKASVLHSDRSRLLLLQPASPAQQFVPAPPDRNSLTLVSGNAPSSAQAYRLSGSRLEPVRHQRVAGGMRITVDEAGSFAPLVLTQEPLVVAHFTRRLAEDAATMAQLESEIATRWLAMTRQVESQLAERGKALPQSAGWLDEAQANLARSGEVLATRDYRSASMYAQRAMHSLARVRRAEWQRTIDNFAAPIASPACTTFDTLPLHWQLADRLAASGWSGNLLPGGDMEQLEHMLRSGWRRESRDDLGVQSAVELSPQTARGGRSGLRLRTFSTSAEPAAVVESPPLWMTTSPVLVRRGQIVRIHGWVRLPEPLEGSREGLIISDSIGGMALASRITESGDWREFTLYRAAARDGEATVTFAISGRGEAWIDDVTIQTAAPRRPGG